MNSSPWRLEGVDDGDEQYPMESHFAVRHTPPDEQDPHFGRCAPTQVRFLCFAVRHTPPDQQDPRFDRRRSNRNLDVTFRVDDFSYKKLFHPS